MQKQTISMLFEKKEHLISGKEATKTKEKIRLKLRLILNNYSKCIIGISNQSDGRIRFRFEQEGFKALYYVFKSSNHQTTQHYTEVFQDLYINELLKDEEEEWTNAIDEKEKGPYYLFIAARKSKRGY